MRKFSGSRRDGKPCRASSGSNVCNMFHVPLQQECSTESRADLPTF